MKSSLRRLGRILPWLQTGWSILGVTLVMVVLLELGLRGVFLIKDRWKPQIPPDPRVVSEVRDGGAWLPLHYRELEALSDRWHPYVYFRQRPFPGQTVTVQADGLRATWQPPPWQGGDTRTRPLKILMLGGSSLWGFGARDDETIPSLIARGLHDRGVRAEVRNLAEIGYVSTQEVIALHRELQQGYRPDLVLFYDGVNDTTSALLEGQPTVTTNEVNRVREFNILQSPARLASALTGNLIQNSALYRFAGSLGSRAGLGRVKQPRAPADTELVGLAMGVVRGYAANLELVEALGRTYGFRPVFVWQPDIFSKPRLVPFEAEEKAKLAWAISLFSEVHRQLERADALVSNSGFLNLSGIFSETESLQFLDFCHTTEEANSRIAGVLVSRILETPKASPVAPASMH
ncbi:MAG: SGNH/GDSL hydrolase family protein [Isosphaeraceae bacterium]